MGPNFTGGVTRQLAYGFGRLEAAPLDRRSHEVAATDRFMGIWRMCSRSILVSGPNWPGGTLFRLASAFFHVLKART